ncbi:MAG TPA: hypothetical protein VJ385_06480 [Fibrobacteria bacterium]|nr:hypothetical protein [Fibrobacteria bacterium]
MRPVMEAYERERAEAERKAAAARELRERMLRELLLDAPGSECVAYDPAPGSCLVTVRQFNRSLEKREFPANDSGYGHSGPGEVETLRGAVLRKILMDRYAGAPGIPFP